MEQRKYGLLTANTMIVGIEIGSGIFFKSYAVLNSTGGNVGQGVIAFLVAAISIVFGSLAIAELAQRTDYAGGVVTYSENFWNKKFAIIFGWFHNFIYYPSLVAVVSWVTGIYVNILFGWENTLERQIVIGLIVILFLYAINMFSAKLGGQAQDLMTIIKLIPLILFAIVGLIFGDPSSAWKSQTLEGMTSGGWIAALPAVLFAFDGWIIATTICHEIKDSKRNLYLALTISPIVILVLYVLYFVGITSYVGVENVLSMGSDHLRYAAQKLLGSSFGAKLIIVFVVISVMGTSNGLILGFIRLPYSLALRKMLPASEKYTTVNKKHGVPVRSGVFSLILSLIWLVFHYVTQKTGVMGSGDVSEISIVTNYLMFIGLYLAVIKLAIQGKIQNKIMGYVVPIFATIGSCIVIWAGFTNPFFPYFLLFCLVFVIAAYVFEKKHPEIETTTVTEEDESF